MNNEPKYLSEPLFGSEHYFKQGYGVVVWCDDGTGRKAIPGYLDWQLEFVLDIIEEFNL